MNEIIERIYAMDGLSVSFILFSFGITLALIITLPFIIKDFFEERKNIKEAKRKGIRTVIR